jgi:hypothetical protein
MLQSLKKIEMKMTRQARVELHDKLAAKLDQVREDLMKRFPEIKSVDLGLKMTGGLLTDELAWRIFIDQKKSKSDLPASQLIPEEILGIPTDIQLTAQEVVVLAGEPDEGKYDPLWAGIQITGSGLVGTLGCFVKLIGDTKVHILSAHHVLMGPTGAVGDIVGQPYSPCNLCCCSCGEIGKVVNGVVGTVGGPNNKVDAAIAILHGQTPGDTKSVNFSNSIVGIGPIFGSGIVTVGDVVRKRGKSSLVTTGTVTSVTASVSVDMTPGGSPTMVTFIDQIEITPIGADPMGIGGDSGSALVNASNQVVGLVFAAGPLKAYANTIDNVSTQLGGIEILSSGTAGTLPNFNFFEEPIVAADPMSFLKTIEGQVRNISGGADFLHAVSEFRNEVMDLINENREVKVAWNRYQGPAFVGHLAKHANEPTHPLPEEINGYTIQNLLIKMHEVLEKNGSSGLASSIEKHAQFIFSLANNMSALVYPQKVISAENICSDCGKLKPHHHYDA